MARRRNAEIEEELREALREPKAFFADPEEVVTRVLGRERPPAAVYGGVLHTVVS